MGQQSSHTRHRQRLTVLVGTFLMVVGAPVLGLVAWLTPADWAVLAALGAFAVGLVVAGGVIAPRRSSFRAGTKIWQNDGLPGGGAGGAG